MVVAMARRAGIPARLVGTTKQRKSNLKPGKSVIDDSFHRWAQVYLPGYGWVRVDATPDDPEDVGMVDVNEDGEYDECDLCTTDPQCLLLYGKSMSGCGLPFIFDNPNDVNGDGVVEGGDIEVIGADHYTEERLARSFAEGVGEDDLITVVAVG